MQNRCCRAPFGDLWRAGGGFPRRAVAATELAGLQRVRQGPDCQAQQSDVFHQEFAVGRQDGKPAGGGFADPRGSDHEAQRAEEEQGRQHPPATDSRGAHGVTARSAAVMISAMPSNAPKVRIEMMW